MKLNNTQLNYFRKIAKEHKIPVYKHSIKTGLGQPTINSWLYKKEISPRFLEFATYLQFLKINLNYFLNLKDEDNQSNKRDKRGSIKSS